MAKDAGTTFVLFAYKYRGWNCDDDQVSSVVHSLRLLLAAGALGAGAVSDRLVAFAAVSNSWARGRWRLATGQRHHSASGPLAASCLSLLPAHPCRKLRDKDGAPDPRHSVCALAAG